MACKFSLSLRYSEAFKENDVALFQSGTGDEYRVKYRSNVCRDLLLNIEWTVSKQVLVTVKLYNKTFKRCFSSKGSIVNGKKTFMKLRGAFNICSSPNYNILCLISVIPYVKFKEYKGKSVASDCGSEEADSVIESQRLAMDKNNMISVDNAVITHMTTKVCEITTPDDEKTEPVIEIDLRRISTGNLSFTTSDEALIANMETKVSNIVASNDSSANTDPIIKAESRRMLKVKHCSSSDDLNDAVIRSKSIQKAVTSNVFVKSERALEKEMQGFLTDKSDLTPGNVDKEVIRDTSLVHNEVISNYIYSEMHPLVETGSQKLPMVRQSFTLDDLDIAVISNVEISAHKVLPSDISEKTNRAMELELQELSMDEHEDFTSRDTRSSVTSNADIKVNKAMASNDISAKINPSMEIELQELSVDKHKYRSSSDAESAVLNNADMALASNDVPTEGNPLIEMDLKRLTMDKCDFITDDLDEVSINNTRLKVYPSMESKDRETFPVMESESQGLPRNMYNVIASGDMDVAKMSSTATKSMSSFFSAKTDLLTETLIQALSTDNCGVASADLGNVVECNTEIKVRKSSESNNASTKAFPVMESELRGLSMDMLDLLMSGEMADAVISNGKKEVKVHKAILSARSSVLKNVFTNRTGENIENRVIIDIPNYVLEDLVVFMYVGLVNIKNMRMAEDLYQTAKKYCIHDLLDICSKYISK